MGDEPRDIATTIIDANRYMVLGTADGQGRPWTTPVYFAPERYREFYWLSSPEANHSRNIAARSDVSLVVFDSQVPIGSGQAVYMSALAEVLSGTDLERGIATFSARSVTHGAREWTVDDVRDPSLFRLYRATVSRHWILCPREPGRPCREHGRDYDHRTPVDLQT